MKVYNTTLGFQEQVVAAPSKAAAARALDWTIGSFNLYANETGNDYQIKVAMSEPGTVFVRSNNRRHQTNGWWRGPRWDKPWETSQTPDVVIEP